MTWRPSQVFVVRTVKQPVSKHIIKCCLRLICYQMVAKLDLLGIKGGLKGKFVGVLSVRLMKDVQAAVLAVTKAQNDAEKILPGATASTIVKADNIITQSVTTASDLASAIHSVVGKLEIIVSIGDQIAGV